MKAYFLKTTMYKRKKVKPFKPFEIKNDEVENIKKIGGFIVGVQNKKSATPTTPITKTETKKTVVKADKKGEPPVKEVE